MLLTKKNSGLDKDSKMLANQIRAIDKRRLIKRLGKLDDDTLAKVNEAIKISLGLIKTD